MAVRKRDLVGRRIVDVRQSRVRRDDDPGDGQVVVAIDELVLDNGAVVTFGTVELGFSYAVEAELHRPARRQG